MKILHISRRQILRAIHAACLALFFAACAGRAEAAPTSSAEFMINGSTVTVSGTADNPTTAFFTDPSPNAYVFTIQSGAVLGNTSNALNSGNLISFNNGSVTNAGSLTASNYALLITSTGTVTNSGSISSHTGSGVYIAGDGTVTNSGTASIYGTKSGVYISGSGTVTNSGTASIVSHTRSGVYIGGIGTVTNSGSIVGSHSGVYLENGGTVTNSGYIQGQTRSGIYLDGTGTVTNSGSIVGSASGVYITDGTGTVANLAGGSISSTTGSGIYIDGPGTVTNAGSITGSGAGVYISGAGTMTNTGTISVSGNYGVFLGSGTVTNSGLITSSGSYGVLIVNNGTVINSGSIYGKTGSGIYIPGNGNVINSGSISSNSGSGIYMKSTGTVTNSGTIDSGTNHSIDIKGDGTLTNSGSMTSALGILVSGNGSLNNSGAIIATNGVGVDFDGNGSGIVTNSGSINATGGVGINLNGDNSSVLSMGGVIAGTGDSILLGGTASAVTIQARTKMQGTIEGEGNAGNVLNLNLVGMTPAQAAQANALQGHSSGTILAGFGANQYAYTWDGFANANINAVSLELAVDSGLTDAAAKIDNNPLPLAYDPLYAAALSNPEAALNSFTGREFLNAFDLQGLSESAAFSELSDERALDLLAGATGLDFTGLNVNSGSMIASLGDTENILNHLSSSAIGATNMSDSKDAIDVTSVSSSPWGAWVAGTVTIADESNTSSNPGFTARSGSPSLGIDYRVCHDLVLGALFNYTTAGANFSDGSSLSTDSELFGLYADWAHGPWFVNSLVAGGFSSYDQKRTTLAPGAAQAQASPNGNEVLANVTSGYNFKLGGMTLTPDAGLLYTHLSKDGFSETGAGLFDLNVGSQNVDSLRTKVGFHATQSFTVNAFKISPEIHATWYHECLDDTNGVSTSVPGAPALGSFIVTTNPQGRDFALVGAGLSVIPGLWHENVSLFGNYDAQVGQSNYIAHTVNGGFRVNF